MHTRLVAVIAACFLVLASLSSAVAQDATPDASPFADLGLPELDVTVTADTYEGIPDQIEAGRYLVNVTVAEDAPGEGAIGFVQPVGMSAQEFIDVLTGIGAAPGGDASTPAADAAPAGGGEMGGTPPFIFDFVFAGGTTVPGTSAQIVIDLTPGEWIAWGDAPGAPWVPVVFEATGEMPAELPEPESSATLSMGEYVIEVTEGELVTGPQVVRVDNIGAQPHFVTGAIVTKDITNADVEAILQADMTGTPPAVDINPEMDFNNVLFSGTQSTGTSQWVVADIPAGNLVVLCFFPDISDDMPHAYHGMYNVIPVGE